MSKIYNELCLFQSIRQLSDFSSDFLQIGVSDMKLNIGDIISEIELCKYDVLSIQKTFFFKVLITILFLSNEVFAKKVSWYKNLCVKWLHRCW